MRIDHRNSCCDQCAKPVKKLAVLAAPAESLFLSAQRLRQSACTSNVYFKAVNRKKSADDALLQPSAEHDGVIRGVHTVRTRPRQSAPLSARLGLRWMGTVLGAA